MVSTTDNQTLKNTKINHTHRHGENDPNVSSCLANEADQNRLVGNDLQVLSLAWQASRRHPM